MQFFQFPEGLYITAAVPQHAELVGEQSIARSARAAGRRSWPAAADITSRDNPMNVIATAPKLLASTAHLRGLGNLQGDGPVALEIEDARGKRGTVELASGETG